MIGIGITTFNRPDMLHRCIDQIRHYSDSFVIHVNDDSERGEGVAASKNRNIAELMDHDRVTDVFLFDDDTWPIEYEWWLPYVNSDVHHLGYVWKPKWDTQRWFVDRDGYRCWSTGNGCMLYYTREALERVGGMRPQFGKWGFEHLEHSQRIYNAGLTKAPFMSLVDQHGIWASDEHDETFKTTTSSITPEQRREWRARNYDLYQYWIKQEPKFVPWDAQ